MTNEIGSTLYKAHLFVNRRDEIDKICRKVSEREDSASSRPKIIVVDGQRGAGKSWLSLHLHRTILRQEYPSWLRSCLVMLGPVSSDSSGVNEFRIVQPIGDAKNLFKNETLDLLRSLANSQSHEPLSAGDLSEYSSWLVRGISRKIEQTNNALLFVLIVDSYMESPPELQKLLEKYLLAPVAALDRSLIILTGRGELPPSMNLSLLPEKGDVIELAPFVNGPVAPGQTSVDGGRLADATELVRTSLQIDAARAAEIASQVDILGGRYPLAIWLLANFVQNHWPHATEFPGERIDQNLRKEYSHVVDLLLALPDNDDRLQIRMYLESLCILDGFKEHEVSFMLTAHSQLTGGMASTSTMPLPQARKVLSLLLQTALVDFLDKRYRIHESVRPALAKYLEICNPRIWVALHNKAIEMYDNWSRDYPDYKTEFDNLARNHRDILREHDASQRNSSDASLPGSAGIQPARTAKSAFGAHGGIAEEPDNNLRGIAPTGETVLWGSQVTNVHAVLR